MSVSVYKIRTATLAIMRTDDGHRIPVTIPPNAVIAVADHQVSQANDEGDDDWGQLVEVQWENKAVRMFEQDIRQRCDRVGTAAS
jgi:hypothetical protein